MKNKPQLLAGKPAVQLRKQNGGRTNRNKKKETNERIEKELEID